MVSPSDPLLSEQPMIKLEFTEAEQQSLHYEHYHHPHPWVQRQMEALWVKWTPLSRQFFDEIKVASCR
jgi:hypothetical protein